MEPPILMLRTLFSLGLFNLVANQNCNEGSYSVISNPQRSTQSVYDSAVDVPLCDYGISEETWFRFNSYSGNSVVEREANDPVPILHCGTEVPIYIRGLGSHPVTDNATTYATVCLNNGANPCAWMSKIRIHRCPVQGYPYYFYLYKLKSPPTCIVSYCVGETPVLCGQGYYWNGVSCVNYLPAMELPIFSGPFIKGGENPSAEIYFRCQVQYVRQPNDANARFRVTFLFDGQPLEYIGVAEGLLPPEHLQSTVLYPDSNLIAVLSEFHLRGRLGREISCQAESYWDGYSVDLYATSRVTSVANYYAAYKSPVDSYSISLTNGPNHNVTFHSTLPFTCYHCVNVTGSALESCCSHRFRLEESTASLSECFVVWRGEDTVTVSVYFIPPSAQTADTFVLAFSPYHGDQVVYDGRSLWSDYVIPTVKMNILPLPTPYERCDSVGDLHLTTFDDVAFSIYLVGDFYLVKAINANQLLEIQTRHEICNGGQVTCNCGVILREGNSAWKISICEAGSWSSTVQRSPTVVRLLSQDPADSSAVYTDGTGLRFSIRMHSGLRVEVDARVPWFNVEVYLPPEYHGKTDPASMCGNSNGNQGDDSTTNQEQFRFADALSYFRHQPNCSSTFNGAATKCGCNTTYPVCSNKDPVIKNLSPADNPISGSATSGVVCNQAAAS